jgi:hypothetical protein
MKKILILFLLIICIFLFGCGGGKETGSAKLSLSFTEEPPDNYDCNSQSRFEVSFTPYNEPQLSGDYLWMFFKLQIDTMVFYESNDIEFPLSEMGYGIPYTLEFGGAIEGEYFRWGYDIIGYLVLVDNDSIVEYTYTDVGYISVTPKNSFSKTMHIEYDCQSSYNIGADTLDTFARLAAAFHIADTDTDFLWDEMNMQDSLILESQLGFYHYLHWQGTPGYNMHLLGIRGLVYNPNYLGGESASGPFGWSFVFVKDICDHASLKPDLAISKVSVHELGHQRGELTHASGNDPEHPPHPELHDSPFCVMNQDLSYEGNNDNDPNNDPTGLKRWFDANPHFCDMCVNAIKNVSW